VFSVLIKLKYKISLHFVWRSVNKIHCELLIRKTKVIYFERVCRTRGFCRRGGFLWRLECITSRVRSAEC